MNWKTTEQIIEDIIGDRKELVKDIVERIWKSIPGIEDKAEIVTLSNNELILKAKNSACLQELSFRREEIKEKMNKELKNKIKRIKLRLGG
ncbi:DciA family protein [Elusimicrobiota bacterium]